MNSGDEPRLILGIGELLWDILPNDSQSGSASSLGGAPANFAAMAGRLGNHAVILSRIGRDDFGRQAMEKLDPMPVDASFLEIDPAHETGRVTVSFAEGEPHYRIHEPAAWDFLELSDEWIRLAGRADAVCFGSLAQRNVTSRQTIQTLAAETSSACIRVFDVNLRAPFYSGEILQESLELATVVKMNEDEAPLVSASLGLAQDAPTSRRWRGQAAKHLRSSAERLLEEFPALEMVAITRGVRGSLLVTRSEWHEHPGFRVEAADPIGAGDAFTAAMTHYLVRGAKLAVLNEAGNRWGSWVASQSGAMPSLPEAVREAMGRAIDRVG